MSSADAQGLHDAPVLVVGGGIGGLAAALAMARAGRAVHLIEQAPAFVEIGAGLQIGPNAARMMGRLGVLDDVERAAVHPQQAVMRDALTGERLTALTLGFDIPPALQLPLPGRAP